jgi:hypothetical protein
MLYKINAIEGRYLFMLFTPSIQIKIKIKIIFIEYYYIAYYILLLGNTYLFDALNSEARRYIK